MAKETKKFKCKVCGKSFPRNTQLLNHYRTSHTSFERNKAGVVSFRSKKKEKNTKRKDTYKSNGIEVPVEAGKVQIIRLPVVLRIAVNTEVLGLDNLHEREEHAN